MNLEELKALAKAATKGPWVYRPYQCDETGRTVQERGVYEVGNPYPLVDIADGYEADEKFIAAANPETVLKLIAVAEAAKETDIFSAHFQNCRHKYRFCTCGRKELLDALKDLERET